MFLPSGLSTKEPTKNATIHYTLIVCCPLILDLQKLQSVNWKALLKREPAYWMMHADKHLQAVLEPSIVLLHIQLSNFYSDAKCMLQEVSEWKIKACIQQQNVTMIVWTHLLNVVLHGQCVVTSGRQSHTKTAHPNFPQNSPFQSNQTWIPLSRLFQTFHWLVRRVG